jgi:integrase
MQDRDKGIDPGREATDAKYRRRAAQTFKDLLDEYWDMELSKTPTGKERKRLVEKDALHKWKKRKITDIKRRDAVLLLDGVRERAPVGANRLQTVLVRMFNFAAERGIIDFSPLNNMRRGEEESRARVLTDDEIRVLWACLDLERTDIDIYRLTKLALKSILLTGQRPGEITNMRWDQLDGDTWIIPKAVRKNNEENRVPVLPLMAEILYKAKKYAGQSEYVFRSSYKESSPVTVGSLANAIRRHRVEMGIDHFTPHDIRRTTRTRLAEIGVTDVVAEKVLGHKLQGILAVYNRYSYDTEKRQALAAWEKKLAEIMEIPSSENVISYSEVRHAKKTK